MLILLIMDRNNILNNLLDVLDDKLIQARKNEPYADHVNGKFMYGRYEVCFFFMEEECEVEITRDFRADFVYLDNVAEYIAKHCITWNEIDIDYADYDYWQCNGFANEADYLRYRYG